jgi:nucleotide-binding universal stress UspA family protein
MIAIRTVLSPVDFSPATTRQIALAMDLCRAFDARLVLHHNITGVSVGAGVGWMWTADHPPTDNAVEGQMRELMNRVAAEQVQVEACITHGAASEGVLAVSEAVDADLVILSTHGATNGDHASVTEHVLERTNRAVLALHDAGADSGTPCFTRETGGRQIVLVPTDLTAESRGAMDFAFDLARMLPVDLHLLHLLPRRAASRGDYHEVTRQAKQRLAALVPEDLVGRVLVHVEDGDPAEGIARAAARLGTTCIVMGEHARARLRRWFSRDTSRAVLHRAPCPVWYVPGQSHAA